jgi:zinc protease
LRKIPTLFLIFLLSSTAFAQMPPLSISTLDSGLTAILKEDHATDLVGIEIYIKAGTFSEGVSNNGISHFIEHLLFAGTSKRQAGDMDVEMESVGATLDAYTGVDYAHFGATVSSRYLNKALEIFADAINDSQFRADDVERERLVILDEIARKLSNRRLICRAMLAERIYGQHPYSLPLEGTADNVKKLTREELLAHYRRYYNPANMGIVLVGDFDSKVALEEINKLFPKLATISDQKALPVVVPVKEQIRESVSAKLDSHALAIGFLGPQSADREDVCAIDVLTSYLGHGYRSWIAEELKTKAGLVQDIDVDFVTQRGQGMISIVVSGAEDNLSKARDAIFDKLNNIASRGLSQGELELAKRTVLGQSAYELETVSGRANAYGFYFAVSEAAFADTYSACINSVTNEAITKAARKYLNPKTAVVLTVEPAK